MAANVSAPTADQVLRRRASAVIPNGMYGHEATSYTSAHYPQFFRSGRGALLQDVNGREYVDLMCAWGPIVLGHQDPTVEAAAQHARLGGECLNGPTEHLVELAETFVDLVADADWAMMAKNGTDATTACLTIARAHTSRPLVLVARGCYHGAAPWCTPEPNGTLPSDRAAMRYFDYNDTLDFDRAVEDAGSDLAAVLLTPFRHVEGEPQNLVDPVFAAHVRQTCDRLQALLVLDDVRCGFRLALGGSWESLGVAVDLSAWSKAIGNGYPIAAITGTDVVREAASSVFLTGSFWMNASPMAAAVATLRRLKQIDGPTLMREAGERLRDGILAQASSTGLQVRYTGPPVMPYLTFESDSDHERMMCFADAALDAGVFLHPRHNWFMSCALNEEIVDRALRGTEQGFLSVARTFGAD